MVKLEGRLWLFEKDIHIVWKKYCNRFCKTLNTGTLPRNPPFHWKAELIFKSYRLQECRNFLVHFSVAPNLLSFGIFLVASILFQPFYFCVLFSLQKLDWGTSSVPCWLLRRSAICAFGCLASETWWVEWGCCVFSLKYHFWAPKSERIVNHVWWLKKKGGESHEVKRCRHFLGLQVALPMEVRWSWLVGILRWYGYGQNHTWGVLCGWKGCVFDWRSVLNQQLVL